MMRTALLAAALALVAAAAWAQDTQVSHGLSLFGDLKYPPDFDHLAYANPEAPKGGRVTISDIGSFDSFNPYIIKGEPAGGLAMTYDTLLEPAQDEPSSAYGLLAESVEVPKDLSWVAFTLREAARWHDGQPVTPEDVIFSFDILKEKGSPQYRHYYANVIKAEKIGPHTVKFSFSGPRNRELPQIVGELPILPEHYWRGREFDATTLEPPLTSGPYRVKDFNTGRWVELERLPDYWARDLPVNRGRHNYDTIRIEYFRDGTVALEAFKAHVYDVRLENNSKLWAIAYDFPAVRDGRVVKQEIPHELPTGMQAFVFNSRRPLFQDARVRRALGYAFDFEWTNKNLFYGQYTRTRSYFSNSELASSGLPSEAELKLLEPLRGQIPDEVFSKEFSVPETDGSGNNRAQLRQALALLKEAGWEVRDGVLTRVADGLQMRFEVLLVQPAFERIVAPWIENMKRLGVEARMRVVDSSQYIRRQDSFDFDVVVGSFGQSLSPGNEQRNFWGSEAADRQGSRNIIGIKDPAIDKLIDAVIYADSRESLITACRALDRVLLWHHYVVPNWHIRSFRVAHWDRFAMPEERPRYGLGYLDTWWVDAGKDAVLKAREANAK